MSTDINKENRSQSALKGNSRLLRTPPPQMGPNKIAGQPTRAAPSTQKVPLCGPLERTASAVAPTQTAAAAAREAHMAELAATVDSLRETVDTVKEIADDQNSFHEKADGKLLDLGRCIDEISAVVGDHQDHYKRLFEEERRRNSELMEQMEEVRTANKRGRSSYEELKSELAEAHREIERMQEKSELADAKYKAAVLEERIAFENQLRAAELKVREKELAWEQERSNTRVELVEAKAAVTAVRSGTDGEIAAMQRHLDDQRKSFEDELSRLREEVEVERRAKSEAENSLHQLQLESDEHVRQVEAELGDVKGKHEALEAQMRDAHQMHEAMRADFDNELRTAKRRANAAEEELSRVTLELESTTSKFNELVANPKKRSLEDARRARKQVGFVDPGRASSPLPNGLEELEQLRR